ncbi:MAG: hypothetical protein LBH40_01350 [Alphaproteobacteria bacterium]|jgi:flagellar basal body-associated protein FliL|nr:hypothetical protein [Alphaproteobacteria bacterium]
MLDNDDINKKLKRLVILLGVTLLMCGLALIIAYVVKGRLQQKNAEPSNIATAINHNFSKECQPLTIEYRESYIAINSKTCNAILIINPSNGREIYKEY